MAPCFQEKAIWFLADLCETWATHWWVPRHKDKTTCCSDSQVLVSLEQVRSLYNRPKAHPQQTCTLWLVSHLAASWDPAIHRGFDGKTVALSFRLDSQEGIGWANATGEWENLPPGSGHGVPSGFGKNKAWASC